MVSSPTPPGPESGLGDGIHWMRMQGDGLSTMTKGQPTIM